MLIVSPVICMHGVEYDSMSCRYERLESPSHWPAIEVPEATTALLSLLEFLRSQ